MKVFVYWNLHKNLWSVKALEGPDKGRVILRSPYVSLWGVTPKVSEAGRQRVLREKRKNVHAGLVGTLLTSPTTPRIWETKETRGISYNPYKGPTFTYKDTGEVFASSSLAYLEPEERAVVLA